jgi:triacylglycerol esterase/lipase EstA (alpha/beta hydrolase family)
VFVAMLIGITLLFAASTIEAKGKSKRNPIIFVHGGSGSGAQFESQAMRFASNGYPQDHIRALQYDSSSIGDILPEVLDNLDALIAELQAETPVSGAADCPLWIGGNRRRVG